MKQMEEQEQKIKKSQVYKAETPHELKKSVMSNYAPEGGFKVHNKDFEKMNLYINFILDDLQPTEKTQELKNLISNFTNLERLRVLQKNIDNIFENYEEAYKDFKAIPPTEKFLSSFRKIPVVGNVIETTEAIGKGFQEAIRNPSKVPKYLNIANDLFINNVLSFDNFCGRGTDLFGLIESGKDGDDNKIINNICRTHDMDYYNAETEQDILEADKKFIGDYINEYIFGYKKYIGAYERVDYTGGLAYLMSDFALLVPEIMMSYLSFSRLYSNVGDVFGGIGGIGQIYSGEAEARMMMSQISNLNTIEKKQELINNLADEPMFFYRKAREADDAHNLRVGMGFPQLQRNYQSYDPQRIAATTRFALSGLMKQPIEPPNTISNIGKGIFSIGYISMMWAKYQALAAGIAMTIKTVGEVSLNSLGINYKFVNVRQDEFTQQELEDFLKSINQVINEVRMEQGLEEINLVDDFNIIKDVEIDEKPIEDIENNFIDTYETAEEKIINREKKLELLIKTDPNLPEIAKKENEKRKNESKNINEKINYDKIKEGILKDIQFKLFEYDEEDLFDKKTKEEILKDIQFKLFDYEEEPIITETTNIKDFQSPDIEETQPIINKLEL